MASTSRRKRPPNADLARLIETCGASHKSLALRVNQLAKHAGTETDYSHTSLANWCQRGMIPKWPVPTFLAQALGERLGRPVSLSEIGMGEAETPAADVGLDFPRDRGDAVQVATSFWSFVNRRDFLTGSGFAVSAFSTPVTRWLVTPADEAADLTCGKKQVGKADLEELRDAADEARRWDSKYGGGNWKANSVTVCLQERAARCCGAPSPTASAATCSPSPPSCRGSRAGRPSTSASTTSPSGTSSRPSAWPGPAATSNSAAMS